MGPLVVFLYLCMGRWSLGCQERTSAVNLLDMLASRVIAWVNQEPSIGREDMKARLKDFTSLDIE